MKEFLFLRKKLLSCILFLILIGNIQSIDSCGETTCMKYYSCNVVTHICEHDNFWPLDVWKVIEIILFFGISLFATSAGIGGGALYSTILIFIENLPINEAFPITTFVMFTCSICTFYLGVREKENHPEIKFVNYDLIIIICPMMLLGTKVGAILNKVTPNIYLNFVFLIFIGCSAYSTFGKAIKTKEDELKNENKAKLLMQNSMVLTASNELNLSVKNGVSVNLQQSNEIINNTINNFSSIAINYERMKVFGLFLLLILVDQAIEGNDKIPSFIGVKKCSILFWIIFIGFFLGCLYLAKFFFERITHERLYKYGNIDCYDEVNVAINDNSNKIFFFSFLGGIIGGMLGLGGGAIIVPLLLNLGIDTRTTVSTSNLLIVFTTLTATILFIFSGQLRFDYAFILAIPCLISSYLGNIYFNEYIRRTNRTSFLIFIIFGIMIVSIIVSPFTGIYRAIHEYNMGKSITQFNSFC